MRHHNHNITGRRPVLSLPLLLQLLLLSTLPSAAVQTPQPPHPATALLSHDASTLYLFVPPSSSAPSPSSFRFLSLALNTTYTPSNISASLRELAPPPLPSSSTTLSALLLSTGSVLVLAGGCEAELQTLEYAAGGGSWAARAIAATGGGGAASPLALRRGARAFVHAVSSTTSTVAPGETFMAGRGEGGQGMREFEQGVVITTVTEHTAYVFGGACPAGGYSAAMLTAQLPALRAQSYVPGERRGKEAPPPVVVGGAAGEEEEAAVVVGEYDGSSNREWPIPEAGFSMTTLPGAGGGSAMSVVMVGGYTAGAFVDMRQVAVYSVPDGRWRFTEVGLPAASPPRLQSSETRVLATTAADTGIETTTREDPSTRAAGAAGAAAGISRRNDDTRRIDPRSGHSAVATRDGKRIVVYGGWVGDINTPAEPRLIILEMTGEAAAAAGRDGGREWRWTIPFIHPGELGPPTDGEAEGLSGHAAVMLEGDVMMITSGYRISPFVNASVVSSKTYFFNVTSGMWAATYKPARILRAEEEEEEVRKSEHRRTTSIVLGVVFGIAGLAAAIIGYHWYFRKGRGRGRDEEDAGPLERERWGSFGFYGGPSASEERLGSFNCYGTEKSPPTSAAAMMMTGGMTERPGSSSSIYGARRASASQEHLGIYSSSRASLSQERVGIVETRSHSYRVLGEEAAAAADARPTSPPASRPPLRKMPYISSASAAVPGLRPPPKAVLKTNPARVSTIFEAEENANTGNPFDPNRASRGSSCAATTGSDDLANLQSLYTRSLAFAEKMAAQETIYEQQRTRSRSTTLSGDWSDQTSSLIPRLPPRAALSSESLSLVPTAPIRIPYTRSFPPRSAPRPSPPRPRVRTLLTPARFFPEKQQQEQQQQQRRVVSLSPSVSARRAEPRRWASISALRSALPDILPTSPISLWETGGRFSRNASTTGTGTTTTTTAGGDALEMPTNVALEGTFSAGNDWDLDGLEAAIERRVVQVLFTAPKGALRVVNLDERVMAPSPDEEAEEKVEEVPEAAAAAGKVELKVVKEKVKEKVFESTEQQEPEKVVEEEEEEENIGEGILEMICQ